MHNQPKFYPQRSTTFYADGRSVRPQVEHTVARGQLRENAYFYTGLLNGKEADMMPFPVTMQVMERGQERYNVYCTPCHSRVGNGAGMIVQRGYKPAGNYHDSKRLAEPLSHFFYVISNGYGAMPDYSAQVTVADRWAIAAYIRALQLSQNARTSDVPQGTAIHLIGEVAEQQGLPASFAQPWPMPMDTNVSAKPSGNEGYPGGAAPQDIVNPPASKNRPSGSSPNGISAPGGDAHSPNRAPAGTDRTPANTNPGGNYTPSGTTSTQPQGGK